MRKSQQRHFCFSAQQAGNFLLKENLVNAAVTVRRKLLLNGTLDQTNLQIAAM